MNSYAEVRDQIEAKAALAAAVARGIAVLDGDAADSLADEVKVAVAERLLSLLQ